MKVNYLFLPLLIIFTGCDKSNVDNDIEIYIDTGEVMCQGNGLTISETKNYLLDANIEIKSESCGRLDEFYSPRLCGDPIKNIHVFTIDSANQELAENIGFTSPDSNDYEELYIKEDCSD